MNSPQTVSNFVKNDEIGHREEEKEIESVHVDMLRARSLQEIQPEAGIQRETKRIASIAGNDATRKMTKFQGGVDHEGD